MVDRRPAVCAGTHPELLWAKGEGTFRASVAFSFTPGSSPFGKSCFTSPAGRASSGCAEARPAARQQSRVQFIREKPPSANWLSESYLCRLSRNPR